MEPLPGMGGPPGTVPVRVSAASARGLFHGCEPDYIRDVCHAKCCDASWHPEGVLIAIHPNEQAAIEARGGDVSGGLLHPRPGERVCPFKEPGTFLCSLHHTPDKPAECVSSPFTFNKRGTLIVRNRWRLLKCYRDRGPTDKDPIPAYRAFASALVLIFGSAEAARITAHLDAGGGDITGYARRRVYNMLAENNEAIHTGKGNA